MALADRELLPRFVDDEGLRSRAFRCIEPTAAEDKDGGKLLIHASGWLGNALPSAVAPYERLYHVYFEAGGVEELDEPDVIGLVGEQRWQSLR